MRTSQDVDQILLRREGQTYFHFITACPVCTATIWALEAYRGRPQDFYGMKMPGSTFGPGLPEALRAQLHSDDPQQRLTAINTLVQKWMDRRMTQLRLTEKERTTLLEALEKKRQQGMAALESFRKLQHGPTMDVAHAAPAYVDLTECAVCNAAVGKPMKLPEAKRGFVLLPRRWVVERSFAWAVRFRRLAKDYERLASTLAGMHLAAFVCVMLARLMGIGESA